jgi:hypothetical protein
MPMTLVTVLMTFASSHRHSTLWSLLEMRAVQPRHIPWDYVKEVSFERWSCPVPENLVAHLLNSLPIPSNNFSDCDEDIDCQTGLSCIQRDLDEIVPGCVGFGGSGWDYCAVPSSAGGALEYLGDEEWDFYELQECQGDCDFDSDCALGLVCNFRDAGDGGVVPGCEGNAEDIATGSEDFCIQRPSDFYLVILADDEEPGGFPLPVCAGDCDNDTECQDGLVCLQRDFEEPVAECEGPGEEGYDYCIPA